MRPCFWQPSHSRSSRLEEALCRRHPVETFAGRRFSREEEPHPWSNHSSIRRKSLNSATSHLQRSDRFSCGGLRYPGLSCARR
jgi:hypothetical protein